ncbi:protein transport protein sec31-like [Spodoptera litura]|uniref:Protein transport protein sec31-like n=1 Tax=Spodoptera litura TaxID=69820 RepID=A0A9J7J2R9_SPOLT|nr:protein transport protein sec31-like [Spodoptera litura]
MPHGGREPPPSPRSSAKLSKGKGRIFKNSRLPPTDIRALQAVARQYATTTPSSTPTGSTVGAGEEFFPPPPSIPDTPASPSPPPRATRPDWPAPTDASTTAPEPMDVGVPHPSTTDRDAGAVHPATAGLLAGGTQPPSAIPRPTARPHGNAVPTRSTPAATVAPRPPALTPATPAGGARVETRPATAPPRQQKPKRQQQGPPAAPTRASAPRAAPPRSMPLLTTPPNSILPERFPSPPKEPVKRQAIFTTPPFHPPQMLPPFAPPPQDTAPPTSYAAATATSTAEARAPAPTTTGHAATRETSAPAADNACAPTPGPSSAPAPKARYPPLIVEKLPDWVEHFTELRKRLGHAPNARPFGKGVRFTPRSDAEYRSIQAYLSDLEKTTGIAWFSYSLPAERNVKVAIRGLPVDTPTDAIQEALRAAGFNAEYVRPIRARQGRPGCLYYAQVARTDTTIPGIYGVTELLSMPGIKIEAWRGKKGPAQCHRCQQFRHSSHNCHRPIACVRCGESHPASECPRPREEPPTCANCGGAHTANNSSCPVYRRETRNPKAGTVARTAPTTAPKPTPAQAQPGGENNAPGSLMAAANEPGAKPGRKRRRRKAKRALPAAAATAATTAPAAAHAHTTTKTRAPAAPATKAPVTAATGRAKRPAAPQQPPPRSLLSINDVVRILQGIVTALIQKQDDPVPLLLDAIKSLICDGPAAP